MGRSLAAALAGVSEADEKRCDQWAASGQELRAAVAWRLFSGKGPVMSGVLGIPLDRLQTFVDTGKISKVERIVLEGAS